MTNLPISIVVSTNGRRKSLEQTLESFQYLDYPNFEVCVISGPTLDGTKELLKDWHGRIKTLPCPALNLSMSRNIGIGLATGDIIAFIDDDAIPESGWLSQLNEAFQAEHVTAAGGFAFNPDGVTYQWRFGTIDRLGRHNLSWKCAAPQFNFPLSASFPHLIGTNCAVRRTAAIEIGGFDETYDYYLDESDFLCRLIDADGHVAQLNGACVHHKFRPSHIRDETRIVRDWYSILKNQIYYSLINNHGHAPLSKVFEVFLAFANDFKAQIDQAILVGLADASDRERLLEHTERAWRDGLTAGLNQQRQLWSPAGFERFRQTFQPFPTFKPTGRRKVFCFVSQAKDAGSVGDGSSPFGQLAATLSKMGHEAHIFISSDQTTVDFENGVWIHRRQAATNGPHENNLSGIVQSVQDFAGSETRSFATASELIVAASQAAIDWLRERHGFAFDPNQLIIVPDGTDLDMEPAAGVDLEQRRSLEKLLHALEAQP